MTEEYRTPEIVNMGEVTELTGGGSTPLADIPGDPTGGYNRGKLEVELD